MNSPDEVKAIYYWAHSKFSRLTPFVNFKLSLEGERIVFTLITLRMKITFMVKGKLTKEALVNSFLQRLDEAPLDWVDENEVNDWRNLITQTKSEL